jgi:hypothetical protein
VALRSGTQAEPAARVARSFAVVTMKPYGRGDGRYRFAGHGWRRPRATAATGAAIGRNGLG